MAYTAEEKAAMAARNDPEQDQESLAEGASIPSSANQTNELHDPNNSNPKPSFTLWAKQLKRDMNLYLQIDMKRLNGMLKPLTNSRNYLSPTRKWHGLCTRTFFRTIWP
ncbi:hypothetical protein GMDG_08957 [Pseudogymnoascus destructans 20631-21]|uniref:Uncharacterized protein n=1 Tax=Pseudogymnoascus destructans (strain ATCC MYA-4855 / 20631-21) TaxID=658429 RepID=L8FTP8_PSED2|nr:hypothetical protein GMDG_08957 [Pseudogymnoascus destructans 20631-21]